MSINIDIIDYGTIRLPKRSHYVDNIANISMDIFLPMTKQIKIKPYDYTVIDLKFGLDIPSGYYGYIRGRSSSNGLVINNLIIHNNSTSSIILEVFNTTNKTQYLPLTTPIATLAIVTEFDYKLRRL